METVLDFRLRNLKNSEADTDFVNYVKGVEDAQLADESIHRQLSLHPVDTIINNRYIYFILKRNVDIIKSIDSIVVLDENYDVLPFQSTFLAINQYYKFDESENNLLGLELPMRHLPFTEFRVCVDLGDNRDETIPTYIFSDVVIDMYGLLENQGDQWILEWKGFDIGHGCIPLDNRFTLLDHSNMITLKSLTGEYKISGHVYRNLDRVSDTPVTVKLGGDYELHGQLKDLDIIPMAVFNSTEVVTESELHLEVLENYVQEGGYYNVLGHTVEILDGMFHVLNAEQEIV